MTWLSDWLREIILIVLIATFVELLLPSNSFHRYVKVVISLLILLVILQPIVRIFQSEWDLNHLLEQGTYSMSAQPDVPSLRSILKEGERIDEHNEEQAMHIIQGNIEDQTKQELKKLGYPIENVTVSLSRDESGEVQIHSMELKLGREAKEHSTPSTYETKHTDEFGSTPIKIEPVKPVNIDLDLVPEASGAAVSAELTSREEEQLKEVKQWVMDHWDMDQMDRVHVDFLEENDVPS